MSGIRGKKSPAGTRESLIESTRDLMAGTGLAAVKARTLATAANVSVGTLYNMFGPLDALVRTANGRTYDELFAHQSAALEQAREADMLPTDRLHALAEAYVLWVRDHNTLWSATLAFNRERMSNAPDWYKQKEQALLGIIEDALGDFERLTDPAERSITARALWASIHGIVTMAMGSRSFVSPEDEIRKQIRIVVDAIAGTLLD